MSRQRKQPTRINSLQTGMHQLEKSWPSTKLPAEQKQTWWRDKLNEYFELITGSMEMTQPGLREVLRERYHCGDGYYDGVAAMEYIKTWLKNSQLINPQYEHYEKHTASFLRKAARTGVQRCANFRRSLDDGHSTLTPSCALHTRATRWRIHCHQDHARLSRLSR